MKFLLDTHILLLAAGQPDALSETALSLLNDQSNELIFSAASIWEVTVKRALGRSDFIVEPRVLRRGLLDNNYIELAITSEHAVAIDVLPPIHKDPFDRILLAQALTEGVTLLTADPVLFQYPAPVRLVS